MRGRFRWRAVTLTIVERDPAHALEAILSLVDRREACHRFFELYLEHPEDREAMRGGWGFGRTRDFWNLRLLAAEADPKRVERAVVTSLGPSSPVEIPPVDGPPAL